MATMLTTHTQNTPSEQKPATAEVATQTPITSMFMHQWRDSVQKCTREEKKNVSQHEITNSSNAFSNTYFNNAAKSNILRGQIIELECEKKACEKDLKQNKNNSNHLDDNNSEYSSSESIHSDMQPRVEYKQFREQLSPFQGEESSHNAAGAAKCGIPSSQATSSAEAAGAASPQLRRDPAVSVESPPAVLSGVLPDRGVAAAASSSQRSEMVEKATDAKEEQSERQFRLSRFLEHMQELEEKEGEAQISLIQIYGHIFVCQELTQLRDIISRRCIHLEKEIESKGNKNNTDFELLKIQERLANWRIQKDMLQIIELKGMQKGSENMDSIDWNNVPFVTNNSNYRGEMCPAKSTITYESYLLNKTRQVHIYELQQLEMNISSPVANTSPLNEELEQEIAKHLKVLPFWLVPVARVFNKIAESRAMLDCLQHSLSKMKARVITLQNYLKSPQARKLVADELAQRKEELSRKIILLAQKEAKLQTKKKEHCQMHKQLIEDQAPILECRDLRIAGYYKYLDSFKYDICGRMIDIENLEYYEPEILAQLRNLKHRTCIVDDIVQSIITHSEMPNYTMVGKMVMQLLLLSGIGGLDALERHLAAKQPIIKHLQTVYYIVKIVNVEIKNNEMLRTAMSVNGGIYGTYSNAFMKVVVEKLSDPKSIL